MQPGTKLLGTMWLKYTLGNPALLQIGTKEEHGTIFWFVCIVYFNSYATKETYTIKRVHRTTPN